MSVHSALASCIVPFGLWDGDAGTGAAAFGLWSGAFVLRVGRDVTFREYWCRAPWQTGMAWARVGSCRAAGRGNVVAAETAALRSLGVINTTLTTN